MTTVIEIEAAIEKLSSEEQSQIAEWLNSRLMVETPAMLAALDEGVRSLENEPTVTIEEIRGKVDSWATK